MTDNAKILFIGDPHFQITNLHEVNLFMPEMKKLALTTSPDVIIIAGDLLHTHERLHTTVLNKAYEFVKDMRDVAPTYILVGNHDYISNTQFLTDNHWMNSMKEWTDVEIVDTVREISVKGSRFVLVPYVYPGRFKEALDTNDSSSAWDKADCIFAHQEFKGCKMGAIVSEIGDQWDEKHPFVVSGHIHSKQRPQQNIYYPGTPMQIAFGESENNIVPLLEFRGSREPKIEEFSLEMPGKKIVYMDASELDKFEVTGDDKVRITLSGDHTEFKSVKKTKKYKDLVEKGVKIVFKMTKTDHEIPGAKDITATDFSDILHTMIVNETDVFLMQAFDKVVNNKLTDREDVFFL